MTERGPEAGEDAGSFVLGVELLALDLSERYHEAGAPGMVVGALACLAAGASVVRHAGRGDRAEAGKAAEGLRRMVVAPMIVLIALSDRIEPDGEAGDRLDATLADAARRASEWADCVPRGGLQDRALVLFASTCALCLVVQRGDRVRAAEAAGMVDQNARFVEAKAAERIPAAN